MTCWAAAQRTAPRQLAARTAGALEGMARDLLEAGGSDAVAAMTAPVTDRYGDGVRGAGVQGAGRYREDPVPLAAISDARRALEARPPDVAAG